MKWYQKALYRMAMSVIPESIKQQMMGTGRVTVAKNANPWNFFNWLPKKYQQAHNIDLTKLQNYTAEELLELLISVGSTETYSSVDIQLYIKTVESARSITKRFWKRAFSMAARVRGVQTIVDVDYNPIDLRTENDIEKDRKALLDNLSEAEGNFWITPEESAKKARLTLGLDQKIPAELVDKLKKKHEQPIVPPTNAPPDPNAGT